LLSGFIAKLANPISGVCFDLARRAAQGDPDVFDRSRQLLDAVLEIDLSGVYGSRSACTSFHHGRAAIGPLPSS